VSDKKVEDLTLLTLRNNKKTLKCAEFELLLWLIVDDSFDGDFKTATDCRSFTLNNLLALGYKFEDDDNTISILRA